MKSRFSYLRRNSISLFMCSAIIFLIANTGSSQTWNAITTGTNGPIYASVVLNDVLYIGGDFTTAGGVSANRIASWNGTTWAALGTGVDAPVRALLVFGGTVVAGGDFTTAGGNAANHIAYWNLSTWNTLAIGMNGNVNALTSFGGFLCAGGDFTTAGGNAAVRLARWTGSGWTNMGSGLNNTVYTLVQFNADLIVGGIFTATGGGTPVARVARFSNAGIIGGLGVGVGDGEVLASAVYAGSLYIGGSFTLVGGSAVSRIARWNGSSWFNLTSGTNNTVNSLYQSVRAPTGSTVLCVGGVFTNAGGVGANSEATWNGTTWATLGTGMAGGGATVRAFWDFRATLSASGSFNTAGGNTVNNVALWGSVPLAPTTVAPTCGATGQSLTPLLDWTTVANAWQYGLQLSTNPNFTVLRLNVTGIIPSQYQVAGGVLNNDTTYYWRVNATNALGTSPYSAICYFTTLLTGIHINTNEVPKEFKLYQNYPNPSTTIRFDIPAASSSDATIEMSLFDVTGREVSKLMKLEYKPGKYEFTLDGTRLTSGVYFYRINAGDFTQTSKMILMK